jgi:VWFA-related protein
MALHRLFPLKQVVLVALLALPCCAQEWGASPQEEPLTILHSASRLVVLDVVVTDASGKPARGLSKDDFTVFEDGNPQSIASFERPEEHKYAVSTDGKPGGRRGQTVSSALTILVIDGLNTPILDLIYAREAVAKFLRSRGANLSQPTALMRITDSKLELLHDYTQDAASLLDALKRHPAELPFRYGTDSTAVGQADSLMDTLSCLEKIAAANANFAGRKNVIWIGQGFTAINGRTRPENEIILSKIANEMRSARLAVYTIDPRGLQVTPPGTMEDPSGLRFFENIARETGGRTIFNRNDVDVAVADSMNDGATYYTLSYYPANRDWNGKFRKIAVTLGKRGLQVRTRTGYFAVPERSDTDTRIDSELASAVRSPLPYRGLALSVSVSPLRNAPGMARFVAAVDRHDLDWQVAPNGDHLCRIMLVAISLSRKERIVKNDIKELEGLVKAGKFENQMDKPMLFPFTGELPADATRLRVVVRDGGNGRIGTADLTLEESRALNGKLH